MGSRFQSRFGSSILQAGARRARIFTVRDISLCFPARFD
jgi:hypothetical protein